MSAGWHEVVLLGDYSSSLLYGYLISSHVPSKPKARINHTVHDSMACHTGPSGIWCSLFE
jgi:hypothetical protein